jgi:hypothetical protein
MVMGQDWFFYSLMLLSLLRTGMVLNSICVRKAETHTHLQTKTHQMRTTYNLPDIEHVI